MIDHRSKQCLVRRCGLCRTGGHCQQAFALVEVMAVVGVFLVAVAILLASSPYQRRTGMMNRDLANLRQMGAWTAGYSNDFEDLHPSFTAAPNSIWPDIRASALGTPIRQAAGQAIDIIRRRTGRVHFPLPSAWLPHATFTHLVLLDYADRELPDSMVVSAGDKHRMNWLDDPENKHDRGFWQPFQNPESGAVQRSAYRWPYTSSFQTPPAFYDGGQSTWGVPRPVMSQFAHNSYFIPGGLDLGGQSMSDISFPAQKTLLFDNGSWYTGRQPQYFAVESSNVSNLMSDGGAAFRSTRDANPGWRPTQPTVAAPSVISYRPRKWEPPTSNGMLNERVSGYYRWTRGGIRGRDFDGPEIDTGQK
jgi:hypothetical protein